MRHALGLRRIGSSSPVALFAAVALVAGCEVLLAREVAGVNHRNAILIGVAPLLLLGFAALSGSKRPILPFVALALPMTFHSLNRPYALGGSAKIWISDLVVGLAIGTWIVRRAIGGREQTPALRSAVLGWPFVLFATAILTAVVRGHAAYGQNYLGQPTRLVLYAAIGLGFVGLDAQRLHRGATAVFYVGTVWMFINAVHDLASGTSQTASFDLSTGGTRVVSGTVSTFLAVALFLALLNFGLHTSARMRALDFSIVLLATSGIVLGFFRAVFIACALVLPAILLRRRIQNAIFGLAPLVLPLLLVFAVFIPRIAPHVIPTFVSRITTSTANDTSVSWRVQANRAVWPQFRDSPLFGVGFGRVAYFDLRLPNPDGTPSLPQRTSVSQDPHDSYLFLAAGGGIAALGSFLLLVLVWARDTLRRLRRTSDPVERTTLIWVGCSLVAILLTTVSAPIFDQSPILLAIWTFLLIPSVIGRRTSDAGLDPGTDRS